MKEKESHCQKIPDQLFRFPAGPVQFVIQYHMIKPVFKRELISRLTDPCF